MSGEAFDLSGQIAVVTGGSRGIGKAIARALLEQGAEVVIVGRNGETLLETAREIDPGEQTCTIQVADVSREQDVIGLCEEVRARHGTLDLLVNNAGVSPIYLPLERTDSGDWREVIDVNLNGVFLCCRHLGMLMLEQGRGSIVNVSSVAGHVGLERQVAYSASKGGVEQLTRSLALEWAKKGVRVNCVAYGFIETDLTAGVRGSAHISEKLLSRTPMGRFGTVEEVAGAVVFLASSSASFITGASIAVDGGWTAG